MNWRDWAGAAGGAAAKFFSGGVGWQFYALVALAGAAAMGGALWWHADQVDDHYEASFKAGQEQVRGEQVRAENRSLLLQREQIITLSNDLTEIRNAYTTVAAGLTDARGRAGRSGQRVRDAIPAGGELDQRLDAAECPVVRTFAAGAFRTAASCRDAVADLGLGAGGLVEASASAQYEHSRADALMRFSMPRSPFTKPVEK